MFAIVEFIDKEGGGLAIVSNQWLTPRKKEVFWPPVKDQQNFTKLLLRRPDEVNTETWKLYQIKIVFYETGDYEIAKKKFEEAEVTSDIQTDIKGDSCPRRRTQPTRFIEESSRDSQIENNQNYFIPKPPKIRKGNFYPDITSTRSTFEAKCKPSSIQ